ncbi:MAG: Crp/Fnr family transcriptional regulator, partial [Litoreibacter sp.]|nr:Crp/Fnr family transcriptional regulator [Litoreibacter sp.]
MRDLNISLAELGGAGISEPASDLLIELLEPISRTISVKKGRDVFSKGDTPDALFVLREGLMEISTLSDDGRKLAHIMIKPGAIFGEMALLDKDARSASVSAKTDSTLWRIEAKALLAAMREEADLGIELLKLTVSRLRWMLSQLEDQAFRPVQTRLARRVSFLLQTMGHAGEIKISQSELAEHVGATREAVSKILGEWRDAGIIEIGRGKI